MKTLSDRHVQASDMSQEVKPYFTKLTESVASEDWQQWEREIQFAESCRLDDPTKMDILSTRHRGIDQEPIPAIRPETHSAVERWIQKAIDIEEKQCVTFILNFCPY